MLGPMRPMRTSAVQQASRPATSKAGLVSATALAALSALLLPRIGLADWSFLKGTAVTTFNKDDRDRMAGNARAVLNSADASAKQDWNNPATGSSGHAEVVGQFSTSDGTVCKRLRVVNRSKAAEDSSTQTLCKYAGRGWLLNPDAKPGDPAAKTP